MALFSDIFALMYECPTRVLTGVPPCSTTSSGTAREVIRLWITTAPGSRASSRVAISAASTDGETISPRSSTMKHRSASPSKARPMSALCSMTAACRSRRFSGSIGFASWLGDEGDRQPLEHGRHGVAAHPVARVDDDLERADAGDVDELLEEIGVAREQVPVGGRARLAVVGGHPVFDH